MDTQPSPDGSDIPGVVGRRSARLTVIVPVTIRGTDLGGQVFKENTWTISVNKHGGRLATFHNMAAGAPLVIENPLLGRTAKAQVIRVCEKRFPEDPYEICVELLEAQNVWGVKLLPEDWKTSRPVAPEEQKGPVFPSAPTAPETLDAAGQKFGSGKTPDSAPPIPPTVAEEHAEGLNQFNMAVSALSRIAGEAASSEAPPASLDQKKADAPGGQMEAPSALPLKPLQEKLDEAQSLKQELGALVERMQSARAEVEDLLLKTQESRRTWASEAEQVLKRIEEAGGKTQQSVIEKLNQEVAQGLASASARLAGEAHQRLETEAAGAVENITKRVGDRLSLLAQERLSKAAMEFQIQCKGAVEAARAELDGLAANAANTVRERARKAGEEELPALDAQVRQSTAQICHEQLEVLKGQIETAWKASGETSRGDLAKMQQEAVAEILNAAAQSRKIYKEEADTATRAISICVDSAVDSLNHAGDEAATRLQATRQEFELASKKAAEEHAAQLAGESVVALASFRTETQAQAGRLESEMESAARELLEKAKLDTSQMVGSTVGSTLEHAAQDINKQAENALALLKEKFLSARDQHLEETKGQLGAAREGALATLAHEANAQSASVRAELQATFLEMQEQQAKEMDARFQAGLQGLQNSLGAHIQREAKEYVAQAMAGTLAKFEQTLLEVPERLYKSVGMAAMVVSEWENDAKTRLEECLRQALEIFQRQLEDLTAVAHERQRGEAEALTGLVRSRLQHAAQVFGVGQPTVPQPGAVARPEPRNIPLQPIREFSEVFRPALEPLAEKQQQIVEEVLKSFRSKLTRILSEQTPKE